MVQKFCKNTTDLKCFQNDVAESDLENSEKIEDYLLTRRISDTTENDSSELREISSAVRNWFPDCEGIVPRPLSMLILSPRNLS